MCPRLLAYIDESGARTHRDPAQRFFVMSAVLLDQGDRPRAVALLDEMRRATSKRAGTVLHWQTIRSLDNRRHMATLLGAAEFITTIGVVVSHDHLAEHKKVTNEHRAWMLTLQFLLERISWLAAERGKPAALCMERPTRLTDFRFRMLYGAIRTKRAWDPSDRAARSIHHAARTAVKWPLIEATQLSSADRTPLLQVADITASSTALAFTKGDRQWLELTKARIWRTRLPIRSYGLKIHPWGSSESARATFAWVNSL